GLLASDGELAGDIFSAQAHVDVRVWVMVDEPGIGGGFVPANGHKRHALVSASDDDFGGPAANALGGERDGLQTGGAETVDGHRGGLHGKTGAEGSDAGYVHALFAFGHSAAENYVVDLFGVEGGDAGQR